MDQISKLIEEIQKSGQELYWMGGASANAIQGLEELLDTRLPDSFRSFLEKYGGGGLLEEEISGIENDDPSIEHRGSVWRDTLRCRIDFALPRNLIVIYLSDDEVVWCLDASAGSGNEYPVVSYDIFANKVIPIADNFEQFFIEYLTLRLGRK